MHPEQERAMMIQEARAIWGDEAAKQLDLHLANANVVLMPGSENSCVDRVSVQVSEYSEENGGASIGSGTIYAVETLFPDGTWATDCHHRDLIAAKAAAERVAKNRGAVLLINSIWPNRKA